MFSIQEQDGQARTGVLQTAHGQVETPHFKAVATKGALKLITMEELRGMGAQEIIANAFLLYLRPGLEVIEAHGGLHAFTGWDRTIYTDCGGFQVQSLEKDFHLKTSDKGLEFRSPFDGSKHILNPGTLMEIQNRLGSDVAMALDHMPLFGCSWEQARESVLRTTLWMTECRQRHNNPKQLLFGIAQGSVYPDLREESIRQIDALDFDGIAFGGLAIGEPKEKMREMIQLSVAHCNEKKPRYVMGVGSPEDIVECIGLGVDTFDSVFPTRVGRHGRILTRNGFINLENAQFRHDYTPLAPECACDVCRRHTKAYMHHLFKTREPLALRLASHHNLFFLHDVVRQARTAIRQKSFDEFKKDFLGRYLRHGA